MRTSAILTLALLASTYAQGIDFDDDFDEGEPCELDMHTTTISLTTTSIIPVIAVAQNAGQGGANTPPSDDNPNNNNDEQPGRPNNGRENDNGGGSDDSNRGDQRPDLGFAEDGRPVEFFTVTTTETAKTLETATELPQVVTQLVTVTEQAAAAPVEPVTVTVSESVTVTQTETEEALCTTETGIPVPREPEAPVESPTETVNEIATSDNAALEPTPIPSGAGQGVGIINEDGACDCACLCGAPAFFTFIPDESTTTEAAAPSTFETVVLSGTVTASSGIISTEEIELATTTLGETSTSEIVVTEEPAQETGNFFFVSEVLSEPVVSFITLTPEDIVLDTTTVSEAAPSSPEPTTTVESLITIETTITSDVAEETAPPASPSEDGDFFFVSSLLPEPVVSSIPKSSPGSFLELDDESTPSPPASDDASPAAPANVVEPAPVAPEEPAAPAVTSAPKVPEQSWEELPEDFDINTYELSHSYVLGNLGK